MKLNLKDEPKEWRKSALLLFLGVVLLSSMLSWRHLLQWKTWLFILSGVIGASLVALMKPRWFRGYHLLSMRLGFFISQYLGTAALFLVFVLLITPMGWCLRLAGKDPLQLRRTTKAATYWQPAKDCGSLDRMF